MKIKLSDYFTYKRLLRFVLPSIVMMIFTSIYDVVGAALATGISQLVGGFIPYFFFLRRN